MTHLWDRACADAGRQCAGCAAGDRRGARGDSSSGRWQRPTQRAASTSMCSALSWCAILQHCKLLVFKDCLQSLHQLTFRCSRLHCILARLHALHAAATFFAFLASSWCLACVASLLLWHYPALYARRCGTPSAWAGCCTACRCRWCWQPFSRSCPAPRPIWARSAQRRRVQPCGWRPSLPASQCLLLQGQPVHGSQVLAYVCKCCQCISCDQHCLLPR